MYFISKKEYGCTRGRKINIIIQNKNYRGNLKHIVFTTVHVHVTRDIPSFNSNLATLVVLSAALYAKTSYH